jgi:hypothetical protein
MDSDVNRSKPDDEGVDRLAAADAFELAVKVPGGIFGIAVIVFLDDLDGARLDGELHTWPIEHGDELKRSSERERGWAKAGIFAAQPPVAPEDGAAQEIVNEDGGNGEKWRRKGKTSAEIEEMETHRYPSEAQAKFQSEISVKGMEKRHAAAEAVV